MLAHPVLGVGGFGVVLLWTDEHVLSSQVAKKRIASHLYLLALEFFFYQVVEFTCSYSGHIHTDTHDHLLYRSKLLLPNHVMVLCLINRLATYSEQSATV